jgi:SAM-dependent methyltransferase
MSQATIDDFGRQWTRFDKYGGFVSSVELLADHFGPYPVDLVCGKTVIDVGAGTGRFCVALLQAGASKVIAVEPSQAVDIIRRDLGDDPRLIILNIKGEAIPSSVQADCAVSLGVLHHIPEPAPVVNAVYRALRPGGKFIVWLYGHEGIRIYLALAAVLRALTKRIPDFALARIVVGIDALLVPYMKLCRLLPLPLHSYLNDVLSKFPTQNRRVVIFDQLRPTYAKYYTRSEAEQLLKSAPFEVEVYGRRGYSWIVVGTKPVP